MRSTWVLALSVLGGACRSDSAAPAGADPRPPDAPLDARSADARPVLTVEEITRGMVHIPSGPFRYGRPATRFELPWLTYPDSPWRWNVPDFDIERMLDFYIDRTEVTVDQYRRCVELGHCTPPTANDHRCAESDLNWEYQDRGEHPVNCVTYDQAAAYCAFRGLRLPTTPEWEMAARGSDGRAYPWGNTRPSCERAVLSLGRERGDDRTELGCKTGSTMPVGSRPEGASPFGVLDMAGNVAEIVITVAPWHHDGKRPLPGFDHDQETRKRFPSLPSGHMGIPANRGGSYQTPATSGELIAWRNNLGSSMEGDAAVGFRCAYNL